MAVFIGGAWPYANGSLHLGHLSSLLPGDVLARYYRLKGERVLYVSGSDCNGTPISIRAKQEGVSPSAIADRYHEEFRKCFKSLGFTYDLYGRTDSAAHHETAQELFLQLNKNGYLYPKTVKQAYCEGCAQFLPDRFVEGTCPSCGQRSRGDQCDYCSAILDPLDLMDASCKLCGRPPSFRKTEHLYFALSAFKEMLGAMAESGKNSRKWRANAVQLSERYLSEGLQDRAATRDLPIGVPVPLTGYEGKKIYVWIEAVAGYFSASRQWEQETGESAEAFWNSSCLSYYVHGKDNIPFHTLIWPAIMEGAGIGCLPTYILSNEYLTVEKKKLSTSRNWAVWVPDMLERYHPDSIRYFLVINAPENRDSDFSWREFVYSHNSELLGAYGNFVNRTFRFIEKQYQGCIPPGIMDGIIRQNLIGLYETVGERIASGQIKQGLEEVFAFIRSANKYFDSLEPWKQSKDEPLACGSTLYTCTTIIANLAQLLSPFLPFSSERVKEMLGLGHLRWAYREVEHGRLNQVEALFTRIDVSAIEEEVEKLNKASFLK